jgi:hypothetical protein
MANLSGANLSEANLSEANLSRANLSGANLFGAILPKYKICPEGEFIAYKKCKEGIVKLLIKGETQGGLISRKCRTNKVKVLELPKNVKIAHSTYDHDFTYTKGQVIEIQADLDVRLECTSGIHFFISREEAEEY